MNTTITDASRWVTKLDAYDASTRETLRERCIADAQREVIEVILNLTHEAGDDQWNSGNQDTSAIRALEERIRQLLPSSPAGPSW